MLELEFTTADAAGRSTSLAGGPRIPLQFPGPQPRFFAPAGARRAAACRSYTGEVASGASCNCGVYTLAPTATAAHRVRRPLTDDVTQVSSLTPVAPSLALLVTMRPEPLGAAPANRPSARRGRLVLSRARSRPRGALGGDPWTALVVRTLPNDPSKRASRL